MAQDHFILTTISTATKKFRDCPIRRTTLELCSTALHQWPVGGRSKRSTGRRTSVNGGYNSQEEVAKRQMLLRNLDTGYEQPYDVVINSLCTESVLKSDDENQQLLAKLVSLVKPGEQLLLYVVEFQGGAG